MAGCCAAGRAPNQPGASVCVSKRLDLARVARFCCVGAAGGRCGLRAQRWVAVQRSVKTMVGQASSGAAVRAPGKRGLRGMRRSAVAGYQARLFD